MSHCGGLSVSRRQFVGMVGGASASLALASLGPSAGGQTARRRPNVLLIITDDQGYGDLGCHGNEKIRTPNLDKLAGESVELTQFYVCPVCSPTRASLMTGRYNYRTGVVDTFLGRSMMYSDEVTIAELLRAAGYRTGIFGKWHLGDNFPLRAIDQGFDEAVVHGGGGIGQPADPPGNSYFDPVLQHNGKFRKYEGYCTDIFTNEAIRFIEENRDRPFFAYLASNAPHTPLEVAESYVEPYRKLGLDETTAKVYGMVTNIDENVGRLLARLRELGLENDTLVIFLTDNGPQQARYNAGMRGLKGTVYEGGIRVPCFVRWPGAFEGGKKASGLTAHIDLLPTILEACGVAAPADLRLDGTSLMPILRDPQTNWPDRTLFFQWHRGDAPVAFQACAVRSRRYKLVNGKELYDMNEDPGEKSDVADKHPEVVAQLRQAYEEWFRDVSATRGYDPPRIVLGSWFENPVILTRQDWRGANGWGDKDVGYWEVEVWEADSFAVTLRFPRVAAGASARLRIGGVDLTQRLDGGATDYTIPAVRLPRGPARLEAWIEGDGKYSGVSYVEVTCQRKIAARPEMAEVADDPALPRVLLIGDSISMGYTLPVREMLKGKANVHRIPDNGGPTSKALQYVCPPLVNQRWDVIHFNWGLHDIKMDETGAHQVPIEQYEANLRELVRRLKSSGARLIWASTTPVPNAKVNPPRRDTDVVAYNAVARKIMDQNGIAINDLYAVALPRLAELQQPANVHFTAQGSQALAEAVAAAIQAELGKGRRS